MPELNNQERAALGNAFDQLGTLAIHGEMITEQKEITKEELRAVIQKVMDKTHQLQKLLQ